MYTQLYIQPFPSVKLHISLTPMDIKAWFQTIKAWLINYDSHTFLVTPTLLYPKGVVINPQATPSY